MAAGIVLPPEGGHVRIRMGIALGLLLALAAGGCGRAKNDNGVATANGSSGATQSAAAGNDREKALKYAQCMREHDIDVPDPDENGVLKLPGVVDDTKKLDAAMQACKPLLPNGGEAKKPDPQQMEKLRQFAKCMRDNGVKNFPDPDANTGIKADAVDPNDPTFKKAQETCGKFQPGGPSANTETSG
jgi:hypothetical protein